MIKEHLNEFGQVIGETMINWKGSTFPCRSSVVGKYCKIVPLHLEHHLEDLFEAFQNDLDSSLWTYMSFGPFKGFGEFKEFLTEKSKSKDPLFYVIENIEDNKVLGLLSMMRIKPEMGVLEIGNITFSRRIQKTVMATEAMFLMMKLVFEDWGYRRYEWKCDALNEPSRVAAIRLGFQFEGIFRQGMIYKNRTRDTAWFSIIDSEWINLKNSFELWLSPENFDENGIQKKSLNEFQK